MTPSDNEQPPGLDDIDALIDAARRSVAAERRRLAARRAAEAAAAARSAPPLTPPPPTPAAPPPEDGFGAEFAAVIEAAQPASAPAEDAAGPADAPLMAVAPARPRAETAPAPERVEGPRGDQVDVLLRRVAAMLDFVESAPTHSYDRATTGELLRELTGTMRQLRDRRDHAHQQMERWFGRWRAAEIQAMETAKQIAHLTAIQDQQTSLLLMARRLCVQEDIFVEWRAHNAWTVVFGGHVLTAEGQWEPDRPAVPGDDFARRTRFTLSEAVTRARALRQG